jgi:hypothetical protein
LPNIGRPLTDSASVASSWRTSQCSASLPSSMRTISVAIQAAGRPLPVKRPWAITYVVAFGHDQLVLVARRLLRRALCWEDLFREADVVTVHLILSRRTRGLVGDAELALMKPTFRLINSSRGPIVDENALIDALTSRTIAGAALDVFDAEPLPADHPFRTLDNLLATPHIGYVAEDLYRTFFTVARPEASANG